jgi:hypothetical protein
MPLRVYSQYALTPYHMLGYTVPLHVTIALNRAGLAAG